MTIRKPRVGTFGWLSLYSNANAQDLFLKFDHKHTLRQIKIASKKKNRNTMHLRSPKAECCSNRIAVQTLLLLTQNILELLTGSKPRQILCRSIRL